MATGSNTLATLNGIFKERYADKVENLIPDNVQLLKMIPFQSGDKELGNLYHQPVLLSHEHGITYAASDGGAFALNNAVAAVYKDAQIQGSQMLLRSLMSYHAAAKASNNVKAFERATTLMVANMLNSISKRLEIGLIYGESAGGIGQSTTGQVTTSTTVVVQMTTASWAPGIWAGAETMTVDAVNASAAIVNSNSALTISAVSLDNRTITLTGNAADLTGVASSMSGSSGLTFYFRGAYVDGSSWNEAAGIDKIITNTGTLFNISASTYNLWKGNSYSANSSALTLTKILSAVARAVERGLEEEVTCLVSPKTWYNLASDQAALRMYDQSYKSTMLENGTQKLSFNGQNGKIDVLSSIYVKEGEAFVIPLKQFKRVGEIDISFKMPGRSQQEDFFLELASNAGYELRVFTSQALFCQTPAKCVKITNIVNS